MEWLKLTDQERQQIFKERCKTLSKAWSKMAFKADDARKAAQSIAQAFDKKNIKEILK